MKTSLFDYHLPSNSIASHPLKDRSNSKLMVIDRKSQAVTHHHFYDLPDIVREDWAFIRNNARVFKARLYGKTDSGGTVECLLLNPQDFNNPNTWWCLLKPGRKFKHKGKLKIAENFFGEVVDKNQEGQFLIQWETPYGKSVQDMADKFGEMPLPPYIKAKREKNSTCNDTQSYQTVFSDQNKKVAAAAPTAGLHFTPELIHNLESKGGIFYDLTLNIGLGTFKPIQTEEIENHPIHKEFYTISNDLVNEIKNPKKKHLAIGTTSVRALEHAYKMRDLWRFDGLEYQNEADIYIYPPANFHTIDALITNFHLPQSTLLCMISSFLTPGKSSGIQWVQQLYREAIDKGYRFYSYGDAMLIL
jgi:S-adenosylmethionine:tRNA ribosyltransferase-isomerase